MHVTQKTSVLSSSVNPTALQQKPTTKEPSVLLHQGKWIGHSVSGDAKNFFHRLFSSNKTLNAQKDAAYQQISTELTSAFGQDATGILEGIKTEKKGQQRIGSEKLRGAMFGLWLNPDKAESEKFDKLTFKPTQDALKSDLRKLMTSLNVHPSDQKVLENFFLGKGRKIDSKNFHSLTTFTNKLIKSANQNLSQTLGAAAKSLEHSLNNYVSSSKQKSSLRQFERKLGFSVAREWISQALDLTTVKLRVEASISNIRSTPTSQDSQGKMLLAFIDFLEEKNIPSEKGQANALVGFITRNSLMPSVLSEFLHDSIKGTELQNKRSEEFTQAFDLVITDIKTELSSRHLIDEEIIKNFEDSDVLGKKILNCAGDKLTPQNPPLTS